MSSQFPNEVQDQELIGKFVSNFNKMFTETKYNLIALNKRFDLIEQCINNVLLLNSTNAFNEKDNKQNEFEIAPEDIDHINELFLEDQVKGSDKKENKTSRSNSKSSSNNSHKRDKLFDSNSDKGEKNEREEENEYIPTGVKPEKKVGKYTEFLKFKQEKDKMMNALNQKKLIQAKSKKGGEEKYLGMKRNKSNKKDN